ncbi:MAG: hypothetical protein J0I48_10635 [Devosia sp.]|nr:hypothetical protein [Devosia sp. 66-22]MBN9346637.1 hypothetical protein [Devosia sp.]
MTLVSTRSTHADCWRVPDHTPPEPTRWDRIKRFLVEAFWLILLGPNR